MIKNTTEKNIIIDEAKKEAEKNHKNNFKKNKKNKKSLLN
jgi:hypothetical protein